MKILVAVKRVVDYKSVIRVKSDGSGVETQNVKMSMNPFDEIAVEEALRLKEKGIASEILIVSLGLENAQETVRTALAMGADRGIVIKTDQTITPLVTAKIFKVLIAKENIQLVITGKQAIDTDNNQVGQMLAALLNWPQATFASKINFHDEGVSVTREIDGGLVTEFLTLPAVITTDLRLNEPRYISLPNIMQAKKKSLTIIPIAEYDVPISAKINTLKVDPPPARKKGIMVNSVAELVAHLKNDAQVI